MELDNRADDLADRAPCGIIADMCDISVPENRAICNMGLSNPQSLAIKQINGSYPFNAQAVSFGIAPLINAAQRLKKNRLALDLFLSDDADEVKQLVKKLKGCKEEQNEIVEMLLPEIILQVQDQIDYKVICAVIDTEADVSGLLANKIMAQYQKPVFILKDLGLEYAGSGRGYGIEDFMAYVNNTGIAKAEGHPNAFGVTVDKDKLPDLLLHLNDALTDVEFRAECNADVLLDIKQIDDTLINNFKVIDRISGTGFEPLTIMLQGVEDYIVGDMSKGKHLKLDCGGFLAIKWNYDGNWDEFDEGSVDMIGTLSSGYFGRTFYRQLIIQDYKVGDNDAHEI
jgi:single-stranded-DNA-specific exonuclease